MLYKKTLAEVHKDMRFYLLGLLTHFSPVLRFIKKAVIVLNWKTNDWFLYEAQHWIEIGVPTK